MFPLVIAADSWAIVGTVAGVAGVCVALIVFWLQARRARKALGYEITHRPLVQVGHEARGKVEIRYDGVEVSDVNLLQVALRNVGRVPILREDFDRPVVVHLIGHGRGSRVTLLQSTLTVTSDPTSMNPDVDIQGNTISFQPVLLNPGDCVTMGVLATGYSGTNVGIEVDARVAGLRTLQRTPDRLREPQRWLARLGRQHLDNRGRHRCSRCSWCRRIQYRASLHNVREDL